MKPMFKPFLLAGLATAALTTNFSLGTVHAADKQYKVAYIARAQGDSFAAWLANSVVEDAKKYPNLSVKVFDGQSRSDLIESHIENAVQAKFDLIILQPFDPAIQIGPVKDAMAKGMKFVTTNPKINDPSIPSVDADPYQQGEVVAKFALDKVPKGAKVVILDGPAGNPHSMGRRAAWKKEFFDKRPDVKILDEQIGNWNKDEGMQLTEDWIQSKGQIDGVISMNDNMAAGAIEALKGANAAKPAMVFGVDGTAEACLLIKDGKMTATALQNANDLAMKSVALAEDILTNKPHQDQQKIEAELITKDNVDKFIEMHKKLGNIK